MLTYNKPENLSKWLTTVGDMTKVFDLSNGLQFQKRFRSGMGLIQSGDKISERHKPYKQLTYQVTKKG